MNTELLTKEGWTLVAEFGYTKQSFHSTTLLFVNAKQILLLTEMLNSDGKLVIIHTSGNVSQTSELLNTQEDLSFSLGSSSGLLISTDHYQRSEEMDKLCIDYSPNMSWTEVKKQIKEKRPMDSCYITNGSGIAYEDQHEIKELREKQSIIEKARRSVVYKDMLKDICLGTLPETLTKENNMFRNSPDCFDIPSPMYGNKCVAKSTQANIDLQVNMPAAKDPEDKMRNHLLERAGSASYEKRNDLRKVFNLDDDANPTTLKDFFARIKDGKFVIPTDTKELERERWSIHEVIEEITWRDPTRLEDEAGYDAANELLTKALNDVSDEIIVKTPEAGLESLRAFQAKTFN